MQRRHEVTMSLVLSYVTRILMRPVQTIFFKKLSKVHTYVPFESLVLVPKNKNSSNLRDMNF